MGPTRPFSSTTPQSPHNYTHLNHNGHSTLPPTCQALRHRPRRRFQPSRLRRRSCPLFGDTYQRAKAADSKEEFFKSKEASTAAASWGSSLVGSAIQTYGVAALINATGTLSYKGSAYLGSLIFMASYSPSLVSAVVTENRPLEVVAVGVLSRLAETVGLSMFLTYWGTRTNPFD